MTSADENGKLLPPDVKSIETFLGIVENPDGTFSRGVGKLPPGPDGHWYRRSVPLTVSIVCCTILAYDEKLTEAQMAQL